MKLSASLLLATVLLPYTFLPAQEVDRNRLRELREKSRSGQLSPDERVELEKAMSAFSGRATPAAIPAKPSAASATPAPRVGADPADRKAMSAERHAQYDERQAFSLERMRQMGKEALTAAEARRGPEGAARVFYVNNESGQDSAIGLAPEKAVRTLTKAVSLLKAGDTLHLAVTSEPYRETLRFGDDFGGVAGKPIVIEGHGATLTGSDPLRLEGWVEAGAPGLYKSAKFLSELEEFDDAAKLMRVFFIFDGVVQHMGRSSKGAKARFKAPTSLQPGEWTYLEAEKAFYVKVAGKLAEAKIEAPYRRNGVTVRAPKVALTHVVIKDLIVCHVLNDGYNLHGTTQDLLLQNVAAYECGDDGISPHETCEVTIDGFWSVGNSTGMGNGYLSKTWARNIHLEGNLAHQFMTGHAPTTELTNADIIATPGTQPINITNAQDTHLILENVQIFAPAAGKVLNVVHSQIEARRITVVGPSWENAGTISVSESAVAGGRVTNTAGGQWTGSKNVYAIAFGAEAQNTNCVTKEAGAAAWQTPGQPFPGAGADSSQSKIPPRPLPLPAAGRFSCFAAAVN